MSEKLEDIIQSIKSKCDFTPEIGIILGSGLGKMADCIEKVCEIEYRDIKGFPISTVAGHKGRMIFGTLAGKKVMAMQGRFHYYEGYTPEQTVIPIRVMKLLGVKTIFISNAAGGLNPEFKTGDIMVITDHINMIPNPLIGTNLTQFGERFPEMKNAYDKELIELSRPYGVKYGCYIGTTGPSYETGAECRFFRMIGADAVGMSTTPEVIAAAHCGIRVFAVSLITNIANAENAANHQEVEQEGKNASQRMADLFTEMIGKVV